MKTHFTLSEMLHALGIIMGIFGVAVLFSKWIGYPMLGVMFGDATPYLLGAIWLQLATMHHAKIEAS